MTWADGPEEGMGIVEVVVAAGVLLVVLLGAAGGLAMTMKYVGVSQQRQSATAAGQSFMEEIRQREYASVVLSSAPAHVDDPTDPDYWVSPEGTLFSVGDSQTLCTSLDPGKCEELVVDETNQNGIPHVSTEQVGATTVTIHAYVTWVDHDDAEIPGPQDYKRVTILARWSRNQVSGAVNEVKLQTFIGTGTVVLPPSTPAPTGTPSPTATPTPTESPVVVCDDDDTTAPTATSLRILSGSGGDVVSETNSTQVTVEVAASDPCSPLTARLSNDGQEWSSTAIDLVSGQSEQAGWTLEPGDGSKTVWARFTDGKGNVSDPVTAQIVLDTADPNTPASFAGTCSISGNNRTVLFTWNDVDGASGYRLYRSDNGAPAAVVASVGTLTTSDTTPKAASVSYTLTAFDTAGNESTETYALSYTKNPGNTCV